MDIFHFKYTILPLGILLFFIFGSNSNIFAQQFRGWETDFTKKSIDLSELKSGGPPKDGIPSIDNPIFISQENANSWMESSEPVIAYGATLGFLAKNFISRESGKIISNETINAIQ